MPEATATRTGTDPCCGGYRHEALLYVGEDEFMAATLPFIREAVAAREPILVVLADAKIRALQERLGGVAEQVVFADMASVGSNPGRIIPAWQDFLAAHGARAERLRGIGEPIWPQRSGAELAECERHEELLNLAFADPDFTLLCPYDTSALAHAVIEQARRNHPYVTEHGSSRASTSYPGAPALLSHEHDPLAEPPAGTPKRGFDMNELHAARAWVAAQARAAALAPERLADLLLAFNEIATNSIRHGGGSGSVSIWSEREALICEVRDSGLIADPLAGRRRPTAGALGGRGLWIANQVADLVQLRSAETGSVVRIHMRLAT
jgi:anti-sigma regulatory factor (Ser/Thr protein kinase)